MSQLSVIMGGGWDMLDGVWPAHVMTSNIVNVHM